MKERKMLKKIGMAALTLVLTAALLVGVPSFGALGDWAMYQNSDSNNGVIKNDKTPYLPNTSSLKWKTKLSEGYTSSFTPPLILGQHLYCAGEDRIYKLSRETGQIVGKSQKFANKTRYAKAGASGYAMHPMTYDRGMIFTTIGSGRIQAFDAETLKSLWVSSSVAPKGNTKKALEGQCLSTIATNGTHVFTGFWNGESREGAYVAFSMEDKNPNTGYEEKEVAWAFWPSIDDKRDYSDPEDNYSRKRGFYWAGAYANDKYVAFASDNGTGMDGNNSYNAQTARGSCLYIVDAKTGKLIDKHSNLVGDGRTNVVYDSGALYWATKGGYLYKAKVDRNGKLLEDSPSSVFLGGMVTGSPVVYNGKIYVGVAGKSSFQADSGHSFAVVRDTDRLSSSSIVRKIPINGYPQAAAILNTGHYNVDFNGDGQADKRVYLYFTYNSPPGGIAFIYDQPDKGSEEAIYLYSPPSSAQEFCLSPVAVDEQGVLYYKNDSGNLFAVEQNQAYAEDMVIEAKDSNGNSLKVDWGRDPFTPQTQSYNIILPTKANSAKLKLQIPSDARASVDGKAYNASTGFNMYVPKEGASCWYRVIVKYKNYERRYKLNITRAENIMTLKELKLTNTNTYTSSGYKRYVESELKTQREIDITVPQSRALVNGKFTNFWAQPKDEKSQVIVEPYEKYEGNGLQSYSYVKDGRTVTVRGVEGLSLGGQKRYPVYPYKEDGKCLGPLKVRIIVSNPDKDDAQIYNVVINWL